MNIVERASGISGMLTAFRKLTRDSKKITFIGCPGWCNPFAELLGYVLRGTGKEMVFVPNLDLEKARKLEYTDYGVELSTPADPAGSTIVLLGGLAMPDIGVDVGRLKALIEELAPKDRLLIGVCIGGVFQKAGWDKVIDFDYIVDADMSVVVYR